jgi:hypothetical protein
MKKIALLFVTVLTFSTINACDICGCGSGNYYIGILPPFHHRFFSLRYQFSHYKTTMKDDPAQYSNDLFQMIELLNGWNVGKRFQLLAFVPYQFNHQRSDDGIRNRNGLGDLALLANYKVMDKTGRAYKKISQELWLGAGLKLPTGKFDLEDFYAMDVAAQANAQIGTGSTDVMINAMYNLHIGKAGISAIANYKINTSNPDQYRFGNKFTANSFIYYTLPALAGKFTITPNGGFSFQHTGKNMLRGNKVDLTGGDCLTAAGGIEMGFNKITIGLNTQLPLTQNFAEGQTKLKAKGLLHISFSF